METLANLESFVRSAETGSLSAAADAFLLAAGHCALRFNEGFAETLSSMSVRGEVRTAEVPFRTTDSGAQIVAVRQGLGMMTLPCFVGNADPLSSYPQARCVCATSCGLPSS